MRRIGIIINRFDNLLSEISTVAEFKIKKNAG
jgi:hypothetical protein